MSGFESEMLKAFSLFFKASSVRNKECLMGSYPKKFIKKVMT